MPAPKKGGEDQAIGRSRGGLSTKIHTIVDALGNPIGFHLTGGEAHDLVGADAFLPTLKADALLADKAYDADARMLQPLAAAGKTAVIPPKGNRKLLRDYDHTCSKHATRYDKTARNFLGAIHLPAAVIWLN